MNCSKNELATAQTPQNHVSSNTSRSRCRSRKKAWLGARVPDEGAGPHKFAVSALGVVEMGVKDKICAVLGLAVSAVLEYDTPKIVHIKDKRVGFLNRAVQLGILLYILV